jgi:hypothetical protein
VYLGPVFLHFLNRELLRSLERRSYGARTGALLFALGATGGRMMAPLSVLIEGFDGFAGLDRDLLAMMLRSEALQLVSDASSTAAAIAMRRDMYEFDAGRYASYYDDRSFPDWLEPSVLKTTSTTEVLALRFRQDLDTAGGKSLGALGAAELNQVNSVLSNRENRAITMSLFAENLPPATGVRIGRYISGEYVAHHREYLGAEIITGLPGIDAFDGYTDHFPLLDYPLMRIALDCVGASALVGRAQNANVKRLDMAEVLCYIRGTGLHASLLATLQRWLWDAVWSVPQAARRSRLALRSAVEERLRLDAASLGTGGRRPGASASEILESSCERARALTMMTESRGATDSRTKPETRHEYIDVKPTIFVSYVRADATRVDNLCARLRAEGLPVWQDRASLAPGERWKVAIRRAITDGSLAFVACFSSSYTARNRSYMNEELTLAIEEIRMRPSDKTWFIPVRLEDVSIPDRAIGGGETLLDLQQVDLFEDWDAGCRRLVEVLKHLV